MVLRVLGPAFAVCPINRDGSDKFFVFIISQRIERNWQLLKIISKCNKKQQKAIIEAFGNDLLRAVCECAYNTLTGNVPLSTTQKRKLARHKASLRQLADKRIALKTKNEIVQSGGNLLTLLLPPIIQELGKLVFNQNA